MLKRETWHQSASELDAICKRFRDAHWGVHGQGWPRHSKDEQVMIETSVEGIKILRSLALAVRTEQDFGLIPADENVVGAFKNQDAVPSDAVEAKKRGGYQQLLDENQYSSLQLRDGLNVIAHMDPTRSDYHVGPNESAHDLLLFGMNRGKQWFAVVSIFEVIRVIHSLPDVNL